MANSPKLQKQLNKVTKKCNDWLERGYTLEVVNAHIWKVWGYMTAIVDERIEFYDRDPKTNKQFVIWTIDKEPT